MAMLFFEGFNLQNTNLTPYLDSNYWSRPFDLNYPKLAWVFDYQSTNTSIDATYGHLRISGYRLDSSPPELSTPLQLSGVSGLNSDKLYFSFRVQGLTHNDMYNNSFPYAAKFLTICDGDTETLTFDVVRTSGLSIQGGSSPQWTHVNSGIGISIKQSGNEIGLFDLRLGDIPSYGITDAQRLAFDNQPYAPLGIHPGGGDQRNRYIHLEFLINKNNNTVNLKLDGFDVLNRLTNPASYSPDASGQPIGNINNVKFYNRGLANDGSIGGYYPNNYGINNGAITLDDLAICNDSGNSPNIWMGPKTRIYLLSQQTYGYNSFSNNVFDKNEWSSNFAISNQGLNTRDGDSTYISSDTSGSITSLKFLGAETDPGNIQAYFQNGIGGVRIFNDVRKTFLDSSFVNVYGTGNLADSYNYKEIGTPYEVKSTSYDMRNSFIFNNPDTNTPWTSGNFFSSATVQTSIYGTRNYVTSGSFGVKKL